MRSDMGRGDNRDERSANNSFPKLESNLETEVVIIGAGITGLTTAMLLAEVGKKVVVLEAREIKYSTSAFSSGHLTTDIDRGYQSIQSLLGDETAHVVAQSKAAAINFIEKTILEKRIHCGFSRLPGYLFTEELDMAMPIVEEFEAASLSGLKVHLTSSSPLPFKVKKAVRFDNQAAFHAYKYLKGIADHLTSLGIEIYENSLVNDIEEHDDYSIVKTSAGTVKAKHVVMATHTPLFINPLHKVIAPYRSYIAMGKLKSPEYPVGIFWDMEDPYHYIKFVTNENGNYVMVGGEDHKTGHLKNTPEAYIKLEKYIRSKFNVDSIDFKWSAQYYEPADGIPYIGRTSPSKNIYVATGFSGDGLTYGTTAAIIIADIIQEKENPWAKTFDANRHNPMAAAVEFIKENADVAKRFLGDRLRTSYSSVDDLPRGKGGIIKVDGQQMAVYKDKEDNLHAVSSKCTHLKCVVDWNQAEKSWDCPCHGSRFNTEGEVLYGPATSPLSKIEIEEQIKADKKK